MVEILTKYSREGRNYYHRPNYKNEYKQVKRTKKMSSRLGGWQESLKSLEAVTTTFLSGQLLSKFCYPNLLQENEWASHRLKENIHQIGLCQRAGIKHIRTNRHISLKLSNKCPNLRLGKL